MDFILEKEVLEKFPGAMAGVMLASGFENPNQNAIDGLRQAAVKTAREYFALETIAGHPRTQCWRTAYKRFGIDPSKNKPSLEALVRRLLKEGGELPRINPVVDAYNALSVCLQFPAGGEDADRISGAVRIAVANGSERFVPLGGGEPETAAEGEVIYVDDSDEVLTRMWNWREGDLTKITPQTRTAVLTFDCLPPATKDDATLALGKFESALAECFEGVKVKTALLCADSPAAKLQL